MQESIYICLSKNSFVRCTKKLAYIANQCTGKQLIYDSEEWLKVLTHTPQEMEDVISQLTHYYENVDINELTKDFIEFIELLTNEGFIITGKTPIEIEKKNNEEIQFHMDIPLITDLTLEVTNRCNERCIHCYLPNSLKDKGSYMSLEKIKSLVDEFVELGGRTVTLTGGEVLLYQDIFNLLLYIHQKQLGIIIYSNLIALTEKHLTDLKKLNVRIIQVSLYGVNPDIHDSITGVKGSCVRTKQSIERLLETHIPLKIVCPVMKDNSKDIVNVLEFAKWHKIPIELELNITARENQDRDNLEHRLTISEMEVLLRELVEYDKEYTTNLLYRHKYIYDENFPFAEYLNYPVCTAGHYGLYITADGKVSTCPNLQGMEMGHVNNSSLKNIWNHNPVIDKIRRITESSFQKCINCDACDYCFRCFARNYTETGNPMEIPEYACEMAFLAKKIIEEQNLKSN